MNAPEDQNGLREALARALCSEWGYLWEGDPYDDDQVVPDNDGDLNDRPSKALFRRGADALIAGPLSSLIAERDAAVAERNADRRRMTAIIGQAQDFRDRARAAEAEITRLKEGMEAALAKAFDAGFDISSEGWNAEYGVDRPDDNGSYRVARECAVARLLETLSPKEQP